MIDSQVTRVPSREATTITRLGEKHRRILRAPIAQDEFLSSVARGTQSHQFLGNSVQSVYARQVAFLSATLREYAGIAENQIKVLDWGCGKGHITYLLRERGFDVTSCDVMSSRDDSTFGQEVPIIRAKEIPIVPLHHPSKLPFDDKTFDCVVSFGVLEHVPTDVASLHEVHRILKPGGIFFLTFLPYFLSWTQALARLRGNNYHDRLYGKQHLRRLARDAGFQLACVSHGQFLPKNSMPIAFDHILEPVDRFVCEYTPLKYLATNLEALLVAV